VIPKTDESGKNAAPTPWVQHYLHRWETASPWNPIPRGPAEQLNHLLNLDPENGSFLPPKYLPLFHPSHQDDEEAKCRDGRIPSSAFTGTKALSVTSLELLARCPYRFYAIEVAGWKSIRPLLFCTQPDPLDWGRLIHRFFERFFRNYIGPHFSLESIQLPERAVLEEIADDLPLRLQLLPDPLQHAVVRRMATTMSGYLKAIRLGTCTDARLLAQEIEICKTFSNSVHLQISGQLDRVDNRHGSVHIVDYKSGHKPWLNRTEQRVSLELGYHMQPRLYPWLYQEYKRASSAPSFSFLFLGEDPPQEVMISQPDGASELLLSLSNLIQKGTFIPTSNELMNEWGIPAAKPCSFCDLSSLCRRFDSANHARNGKLFERLARQRFENLTRTV
jgi:hypothetical protein